MTHRHHFRLVELYVTCIIILTGICLLSAVTGRLMADARKLSCSDRLRGISRGLIGYSNDADGLYPWGWSGKIVRTWDVALLPYLNDPLKPYQAFDCPQSRFENLNDQSLQKLIRAFGRRSYIANSRLFPNIKPGHKQFSVFNIKNTMRTGVIFDGPARFVGSGSQFNTAEPQKLIFRHDKQANVLFADGHANAMSEEEISKEKTFYP